MMAAYQYVATGNETNDGINTEVYMPPGYAILDVLVKGKSKNTTNTVSTGQVLVYELLDKGDVVTILYNR